MAKDGPEEGPRPLERYFASTTDPKNNSGKTQPNQRYVYNENEYPVTQEDKPEIAKKVSGMSTKELALYFGSFLGAGIIFYFFSPAIPDEILVQALIAMVGLARQRYLSKK